MPTENTSLKNITPTGDFNSTDKLNIGKSSIYRHPFFIVAASLLAWLVLVAVAGKGGVHYSPSSAYGSDAGTLEVANYVATIDKSALMMDIFGTNANSEKEE